MWCAMVLITLGSHFGNYFSVSKKMLSCFSSWAIQGRLVGFSQNKCFHQKFKKIQAVTQYRPMTTCFLHSIRCSNRNNETGCLLTSSFKVVKLFLPKTIVCPIALPAHHRYQHFPNNSPTNFSKNFSDISMGELHK